MPTMSRYLTPGKVALLCLVELYCESRVPNAAVLEILSFVVKHLVTPKDSPTHNFNLTLDEIQGATANVPSAVVGRTVFDLLLKKLWEINSFDAFHDFFSNLTSYLVDSAAQEQKPVRVRGESTFLSRTSVLGCYFRRAHVEYVRLQFQEATAAWKSFILFREPTLPLWKKRNLGAGPLSFDCNLRGMNLEDELVGYVYGRLKDSDERFVSTDDVERLLEFQVDAMQRIGTRIPDEMQEQLAEMLRSHSTIPPLSHYVDFLNAWRGGDYTGSFDNLHRYFDYTMQTGDRTFYQYALLNLAIMQADFGCYRESILAMQETTRTARENKDMACLNFAFSWLYHFYKAHPQECPDVIASRMERDPIQFLKVKAKEGGMHHLQSMAYLSEAKQILSRGDSIPAAFESILRSSHLNVTKSIRNGMGSQILLQSSLWNRLGISYLAVMYCDLFLAKYKTHSPVEDIVKAECRAASMMSMTGRFDEALARIESLSPTYLRTLKVHQYWASYIGLLKLRRAIHHGDLTSADLLLLQLSSNQFQEPEYTLEISISKIDLQIRRGNFASALLLTNELADQLERERADFFPRVRLMLLKADLLAKTGRPLKGLSLTLRSASISWRARLLPTLFNSICTLSHILNSLSEFAAAESALDSIMPQVLECEDTLLNARAFEILSDTQMGLAGAAGNEGAGAEVRKMRLLKAFEFMERATGELKKMGDKRGMAGMCCRKARVLDYLGERVVRDDVVQVWRELRGEKD